MTVDTPNPQYYDDVIDLRAYVLVLVRFWPVIVGMVLIAVLAATGLSLWRPVVYEATSSVVITQSRAELSLVPEFKTSTEGLPTNAEARRTALIALVPNSAIATTVIERLGEMLPPEMRNPSVLSEAIAGTSNGSDLIAISMRAEDPAVATAVANAWAEEYERYINLLYGVVVESSEAIQKQAERGKSDYEAAQAALVTFMGGNRIQALELEIEETQAVISATAKAQVDGRVMAFSEEHTERVDALVSLHDTRLRLTNLLADARALETQLATGGEGGATTNALALTLLKAQAYASSSELPATLQLQLGSSAEIPTDAQGADVRALVASLETRIAALDAAIAAWEESAAASAGARDALTATSAFDPVIASLQERLRSLQSQLEAERATLQELTHTRDLAWEAYTTVARKVAEMNVGSAVQGTVVRFAAPAAPPTEPMSRKLLQTAALAGAVAFVLAVGIAFFTNLVNPSADPSQALRARRAASDT